MANIRARTGTGMLFLDFHVMGVRYREQTALTDSPTNRKILKGLANRIDCALASGSFVYRDFFPNSSRAQAFSADTPAVLIVESTAATPAPAPAANRAIPSFAEFAGIWFLESEPRWRKQHRETMRRTLDNVFIPRFGDTPLTDIVKADLLGFRAEIAKRNGRAGQTLSGKRINKLMAQLNAILDDGCQRYDLHSPSRGIKPLKQKRTEVLPFTLDEVNLLINTVRPDYRAYLTLRLLTGLRTGEADGLQWQDIDFEANTLRVERTVSRNGDGDTKTEGSKRTIPLVPQVRDVLKSQHAANTQNLPWVFHTKNGHPIDVVNFTNRVWYPLLRHLGMKQRPPYQMRHTAATLMLASGENPEWIAAMLGHSTTEMLFRVYSRFVPNLTRNDGRAYTGLLNATKAKPDSATQANFTTASIAELSLAQKAQLLAELTRQIHTN